MIKCTFEKSLTVDLARDLQDEFFIHLNPILKAILPLCSLRDSQIVEVIYHFIIRK
jgi:hypothetical protein